MRDIMVRVKIIYFINCNFSYRFETFLFVYDALTHLVESSKIFLEHEKRNLYDIHMYTYLCI